MPKLFRPLVIILAIILVAIAGIFFLRQPDLSPTASTAHAHYYKDPNIDISKIALKVFYVAAANQKIANTWQLEINKAVQDISEFHSIQFHGLSTIKAEIYPEPVKLSHDSTYYDTENTNFGNPEGLRRIIPELENNYEEFLKTKAQEFRAIAIIYEGVGASGSSGAMILSRTYLSDPQYATDGSAIFYHEFAHTYGLPDRFDPVTNIPQTNDIMGSGRFKPIATDYLDPSFDVDLGLSKNP